MIKTYFSKEYFDIHEFKKILVKKIILFQLNLFNQLYIVRNKITL